LTPAQEETLSHRGYLIIASIVSSLGGLLSGIVREASSAGPTW